MDGASASLGRRAAAERSSQMSLFPEVEPRARAQIEYIEAIQAK
jgi:hypothetical protein